jgi:hypothetical protein
MRAIAAAGPAADCAYLHVLHAITVADHSIDIDFVSLGRDRSSLVRSGGVVVGLVGGARNCRGPFLRFDTYHHRLERAGGPP